ncbi:MAG TPA: branched-chain amino acid ABC transporter permease, partial [Candidatus Dormibacteraeota bacterium]|nr:branched-chain amino acid ABC transporter permease [Candidatus Dormibacteraeota bacterium]
GDCTVSEATEPLTAGGTAAPAPDGDGFRLVAREGLVPRRRTAGGIATVLGPPLRLAYRLISDNFTLLLLLGIAGAVVGVYHKGGGVLTGEQIRNAMVLGAIYALVAIGYTMVYGIIELINFAHGDVFAASGFFSIFLADQLRLGPLATSGVLGLLGALAILFPLSMLAAGLLGMLIERVAYRRLRDAPRLAPLITAIGVSFFIEGILLVRAGPDNVATDNANWISGGFTVAGVAISSKDIFVVGTALVLMFALGAFVRTTLLGKAMRATAQDRSAALLCGININRTISATFFIGSALAAAGALIYSINYGDVKFDLGFRLGIIAFTAAVLGGIGNIVGAGIGGFIIGIIYVFGGSLAGGAWSESLIFAILVLILTFRPVGLFGVDVTTRA